MSERWKFVVLSLFVVGVGVVPSASASPSIRVPAGIQSFSGTTSSGGEIQFNVKRTSTGQRRLTGWFIWAPLTCDDATVVTDQAFGYGFSPYVRLDGRRLDHQAQNLDVRYRIEGTFRNHEASGWVTFRVATFAADATPQSCGTGRIDWTATA